VIQHGRPTRAGLSSALGSVLSVYPNGVVLTALATMVRAPQAGVLALAAIFLPHLCLAAVALAPAAVLLRHRVLRAALVLLTLVTVMRFGPEWVSLPRAAGDRDVLTVATWNPLSGGTDPERVIAEILATDAQVVALQELTPDVADALAGDAGIAARFPHRLLAPEASVLGMGLLSAYPITQEELLSQPPGMHVRLDLGPLGGLVVINGHPLPGSIGGLGGLPVSFDGTTRDAATGPVRDRIDTFLAHGEAGLVLGDYNVTPTEPGYRRLAEGLRDAHAEAGTGTGWTWRPHRLAGLGIGLLRIDYIMTSPELEPIGTELRCGVPGDHCLLIGRIALPAR
jgi:vancomycin resistance protein VanJ